MRKGRFRTHAHRQARKEDLPTLTQNQLQELLESEPVKAIVEASEEQGFIEATSLETMAQEQELNEEDLEQLRHELESIGFEIRTAATDEKEAEKVNVRLNLEHQPLSGSADSLQLFLADVGKHKLLTAADEVALAKRIERGDPVAKRHMGSWLRDAIFNRDYPVLQGGILFLALVFVLVNLVVDVLYAVINPRIRYS